MAIYANNIMNFIVSLLPQDDYPYKFFRLLPNNLGKVYNNLAHQLSELAISVN